MTSAIKMADFVVIKAVHSMGAAGAFAQNFSECDFKRWKLNS